MPINALPSGPGLLSGTPALPGGDRKGEEVQMDPAFAALLAALVMPAQGQSAGMNLQGSPTGQQPGLTPSNAIAPTAGPAAPAQAPTAGALQRAAQALSMPTSLLTGMADQQRAVPEVPAATGTDWTENAPTLPTTQATRLVEALLAEATAQGQQPVKVLAVTQGPPQPQVQAQVQTPVEALAAPIEAPAPTAPVAPPVAPVEAVAPPTAVPSAPVEASAPPAPATILAAAAAAATEVSQPAALTHPVAAQRAQPASSRAPEVEPVTEAGPTPSPAALNGRTSGETAPVSATDTREQKNTRDGDHSLHQSRQPEAVNVPVMQQQTPVAEARPDRLATRLPNPVEPGRLMETIPRALAEAGPGNYTVTLQLHPEHLGEVRLQVQLIGQQVHTMMEVANPAARQALEANGDQLRQGLNQAGLTLAGFQVSTGQGGQSPREQQTEFAEQLQDGRRVSNVRTRTAQPATPPRVIRDRTGARIDTLV
ncbi:MAG: flagellar hook-length control protein FliK [Mycobacterium leprae]